MQTCVSREQHTHTVFLVRPSMYIVDVLLTRLLLLINFHQVINIHVRALLKESAKESYVVNVNIHMARS